MRWLAALSVEQKKYIKTRAIAVIYRGARYTEAVNFNFFFLKLTKE